VRKMPKRSREEKIELRKLLDDFVRVAGGTYAPADWYPWCIETPYGKLRLVMHPHGSESLAERKLELEDGYLTIFGRFDEPGRAPVDASCGPHDTVVDSNRHTGKWNHHGGNVAEGRHVTAEAVFDAWVHRLARVRPVVQVARRVGYTMFAVEPWGDSAKRLLDQLFGDAAWSGGQMLVDHRYLDEVLDVARAHGAIVK
jgi:hypothetical protein